MKSKKLIKSICLALVCVIIAFSCYLLFNKEPIVGTWKLDNPSSVQEADRRDLRFNSDGTFVYKKSGTESYHGSTYRWEKCFDNGYTVSGEKFHVYRLVTHKSKYFFKIRYAMVSNKHFYAFKTEDDLKNFMFNGSNFDKTRMEYSKE